MPLIVIIITCILLTLSGCSDKPIIPDNDQDQLIPLTEQELLTIRDDFDKRVADIFNLERGKILVRDPIKAPLGSGRPEYVREYISSLASYAGRCFWFNEHINEANAALAEGMDYFLTHVDAIYDRDNFHWNTEIILRLVNMFGQNGTRQAGLMTQEVENSIMETTWLYAKRHIDNRSFHSYALADHEQSNTWFIYESENHHVQIFSTLWYYAKLAKERVNFRDRVYDDGRKAAEHYASWNDYVKMYFRERAKKGLFIEMMCTGYNLHVIKCIFNFYDFSEDPTLKKLAGYFLDLYFTYWGQEQINGIACGGQSRVYANQHTAPRQLPLGYLFFAIGDAPTYYSTYFTAMTTSWRPSLVTVDIACNRRTEDVYEIEQYPLGLTASTEFYAGNPYRMRTDMGKIIRYSYCTPEFIIGTIMCPALKYQDWTNISSQNRLHGIRFSDDKNACIIPQCEGVDNQSTYNSFWSVQKEGTLICQKLKEGSRNTGEMRVWFSNVGLSAPIGEDGWIFTESKGAYAAVRIVDGTSRWQSSASPSPVGRWLYADNDKSPVIIEVAQKKEYKSFEEFRRKVINSPLSFKNNVLHYTGIYGNTFTFYADYSKEPEINSVAVSYVPKKAFDSPFLQSDWDSGIIRIQKRGNELILDFN